VIPRLIANNLKAIPHHCPHLAKIHDALLRQQLHQQVANGRSLNGARQDRTARCIGNHLAQNWILNATTHYMDPVDSTPQQDVQFLKRPANGRCHAF
jgi:hypothetical protein